MVRLRSTAVALFAVLASTLAIAACSSAPEQPILYQFFTASRLGDTTSLESFATVVFEANRDGTVNSFTITSVSPERSSPLGLKPLGQTLEQVKAEDAEFTKRKVEYQTANLDAIKKVLKAEAENTTLKGKDAEVQAAWTKLREETKQMTRKVAEARNNLAAESTIVNLSVSNPGTPAVDPTKYDGEMVTKDVTVSASMKLPSGQSTQKTLVVTMERAVLKGDKTITGRWIITGVKDPSVPAGTKAS
jgi:hypothetical protein